MKRWVISLAALLVISGLALGGGYKLMTSRTFQLFGGLTERVETPRKVVALTFDDGPTRPDVDAVITAVGGEKATAFVNGMSAEQCPVGARRLVAAGFELGNHTWDHRRMVMVTPQIVADEIESTDAQIRAAGQTGEITFRPPYGKKLVVLPWWLSRHDRHTIMWDVSPETWDGPPQDADTITRGVVSQVRPGSIVLLHPWNGRTETQRALPAIIKELRGQGYTFVTVSELVHG